MNFGESLAYWYLRLNGFFPLENFVLHRHGVHGRDADTDLLAVRFPYVFEPIGGQDDDWDHQRFTEWGLNHRQSIVCMICEVKTGQVVSRAMERSFLTKRLNLAVQRFGAHPPDALKGIVNELGCSAVTALGNVTYAKLLIGGDGCNVDAVPCCRIALKDTVAFIRSRMAKYRNPKQAARMFFPGDLIQFLAWEAGLETDVD